MTKVIIRVVISMHGKGLKHRDEDMAHARNDSQDKSKR